MKLREIERLRACAALLVLVVHWDPLKKLLPWVVGDPWSGVDLFFVISGYVVSLSLVRLLPALDGEGDFLAAWGRSRGALKTFYVRRFFRIMPAALAVALASRALAGVFPQEFGSVRQWGSEFVAFFGGIYNYRFAFGGMQNLFVYWSLSVEEHFYLLLPMMFILFRTPRRRMAACAVLALFSIIARSQPPPESNEINTFGFEMYSSHLRFDSLMAGVFLALVSDLPRTAPILPPRFVRVVIVPLVLFLIAGLPRAAAVHVTHRAGFIALWMMSGLLVSYAAKDEGYVLAWPGVGRALEYLGARSYAIYLVHSIVGRVETSERAFWPAYAEWAPDGDYPWRRVLVLFAFTLLLSELLYRAVEQPFLRLGRHLLDRPGALVVPGRIKALGAVAAMLFGVVYFRHTLLGWFGPPDIARGAAVYTSSILNEHTPATRLTDGRLEPEMGTHTRREDHPWMTVDLGRVQPIGAIRVYNRDDGYVMDDVPLEMQISEDGEHFRTVAKRELLFTQEWPWRIKCVDMTTRFVRFTVTRESAMCLSEIEIYASQLPAAIP